VNAELSNDFAGRDGVIRARVLARLESAAAKGLSESELAAALQPGIDIAEARAALHQLAATGVAVEWNRRWVALRYTEWVVGIVELLESGDGLLRSGARREAGFYIGKRCLKGAGDGDVVLVKRLKRQSAALGRRLPEASVVLLLDRRYKQAVGTLDLGSGRRWLVPYDSRSAPEIEVIDAAGVLEDQWVVVEVEPGDGRGGPPRGRVREVLGRVETPGVDVEVVLRHYQIPEAFPPLVLAAAAALPQDPGPLDWRGREDLRGRPIVTIDGESARDFDDAISLERLAGNRFRLGVHIADVAHYVEDGSALDLEAYRRGTSVYYPERAIPMLPERLSNGLCSLRPNVPRLAMSVFLDLGGDGQVLARRFAETVIESSRRLTYNEVRRVLEEPRQEDEGDYGAVLPLLRDSRELMQVLNRARMARGSMDFDLPEGDVILDTDGQTVGIQPGQRNVAHRIVEEFMIAANEAVAWHLESSECPALHRVHDPPTRERLEELREMLRALGIALRGDLANLHPGALQEVLDKVRGRPEEAFVSAVVLRSVQRAVYSPEPRGHYALAARHYLHFTSPIRRYPDLLAHRRLKSLLRGKAEGDAERSLLAERLPVMAEHTSTTERRAEQSERDLLQWKKVRFLESRVGETFRGRVTGVQPFGLFVQIENLFVDGLVPVRSMADDYYVYEPEAHRLVGEKSGRRFQLADAVEVVLVRVDHRHRGLDLKIVGMPEPRPRAPRGRPRPGGRR
jgi:ribonuclease R